MAQLPPKSPTMIHQNWPSFPTNHHPMMPIHPPSSTAAPPPFWVDEFLDFSSSRRNSHRRSVSDPIAFAEVHYGDECHNDMPCNDNNNIGFERLDDEQLCSMFSDEVPPAFPSSPNSSTNPSSSADQNSENDEKTMNPQQPKKEPGEDNECQPEKQSNKPSGQDTGETIIVDPKRVKRILANRQSAQRSRVRKLQYISELERSVTSLQSEVSALSPRVAYLDHQRLILNVDNSALKQRIAALTQDKLFKDAHQEALKKEIERLRKVYQEQNLKKMDNSNVTSTNAPPPAAATNDHHHQQQ